MSFCSEAFAIMISSKEQLALLDICIDCQEVSMSSYALKCKAQLTPWRIPAFPAARTRFISPSGCPKRASAAGAIKMANVVDRPVMLVAVDTLEILFNLS